MPSTSILERERTDAECPRLSPLNDYVYVRQERIPDQAGRFILPDSARMGKVVRFGTVLAVGPGRLVCFQADDWKEEVDNGYPEAADGAVWITKRIPLQCKVGDRVAFPDTWGQCVFADTDPSLLLGPETARETAQDYQDGLLAVMPR